MFFDVFLNYWMNEVAQWLKRVILLKRWSILITASASSRFSSNVTCTATSAVHSKLLPFDLQLTILFGVAEWSLISFFLPTPYEISLTLNPFLMSFSEKYKETDLSLSPLSSDSAFTDSSLSFQWFASEDCLRSKLLAIWVHTRQAITNLPRNGAS